MALQDRTTAEHLTEEDQMHDRDTISSAETPPASLTRTVGEAEHLRVSMTDDVVVIEPVDVPDRHSVDALDRLLSEVDAPAVIDLRHCTPVAAKLLSWLDPRRWGRAPGSVSIVTGRGDRAAREEASTARARGVRPARRRDPGAAARRHGLRHRLGMTASDLFTPHAAPGPRDGHKCSATGSSAAGSRSLPA